MSIFQRLSALAARWTARARWRRGLGDEVDFWSKWLGSRGLDWREDFRNRLDPALPLQPKLQDLIGAPEGATVRLLDVGAGPLTALGKVWPGRTIEISAVDPLADEYDRILDKHGIIPPVRTVKGEGERLTELFPRDHFDAAYAKNCLDHCYDPLAAIRRMLTVVKEGGIAQLEHATNEAEHENYTGLHQWNFCAEDGRFMIWRPGTRIDVETELAGNVDLTLRAHDTWIVVTIRKRRGPVSSVHASL